METNRKCYRLSSKAFAIFAGFGMNSLLYYDKGALASIVHVLKDRDSLDLSLIDVGGIGFATLIGYVIGILLFEWLRRKVKCKSLIAIGLISWIIAGIVFGVTENYYIMMIARICTGIGEAGFIYLIPHYILYQSDENTHNFWFSSFFAFWWFGYGIGYLLGAGILYSGSWMGLFIIESGIMFIFTLLFLLLEIDSTSQNTQSDLLLNISQENPTPSPRSIWSDIYSLMNNQVYVKIVYGYTSVNFALSGFIYWSVYYLTHEFGIQNLTSLLFIGFSIFFLGALGTMLGLTEGDNKLTQPSTDTVPFTNEEIEVLKSVRYSQYIGVVCMVGSLLCILGVSIYNEVLFLLVIFLGLLLIIMYGLYRSLGAFKFLIVSCVKPELRIQGQVLCIVLSRIFGDFVTCFVTGLIGEIASMYAAFVVLFCACFLGSVLWMRAWRLAKRQAISSLIPLEDEDGKFERELKEMLKR
jgi:MFS family permease